MMKVAMSRAASGLLRALLRRAGEDRNRIVLTEITSVDWQSLTFVGERHRIVLRIIGEGSAAAAMRITRGIEDAEFSVPGHIVADIAPAGPPAARADGGMTLVLEALTVEE